MSEKLAPRLQEETPSITWRYSLSKLITRKGGQLFSPAIVHPKTISGANCRHREKKRGFYQYQSAINVRRHYSCSARHVCVCRGTCWMHASPHGYLYKSYDGKSVARFNVSSRPDTTERGKTKSEMTKFGCFFRAGSWNAGEFAESSFNCLFHQLFSVPSTKGGFLQSMTCSGSALPGGNG